MRPQQQAWSKADEQYLRDHYAETPLDQMAEQLQRTTKAIRSRAKLLKVVRAGKQPWTAEETEYIRTHYADTLTEAIAKHLNRTVRKIYSKAKRMGLEKSEAYILDPANRCRLPKGSDIGKAFRFQPGDEPVNKGIRRPGYAVGRMAETQFKQGSLNGFALQRYKPVGTILADPEGYLRIKVREHDEHTHGWHKDVWPLLHHKIWTDARRTIPEGHVLVFKDRDRSHCSLDNLECISRGELANRNQMWNNLPRELAEVIQLNGVLKRKLRSAATHAAQ